MFLIPLDGNWIPIYILWKLCQLVNSMLLEIEPLTREAFAPYGDVIEKFGALCFETNGGQALRYHDLARLEGAKQGRRPLLSIFHARPYSMPLQIVLMERHPLSSQAFVPINGTQFIVIVGEASTKPTGEHLRGFVTNGIQGVNYRPGTWHHPLVTLTEGDYLVVDHTGPGQDFNQDYEEILFERGEIVLNNPTM